MSKPYQKYDEEFKKNIVELHKNGKSQTQLHKEYGVSYSALSKWIQQYSGVKMEDDNFYNHARPHSFNNGMTPAEKEKLFLINSLRFLAIPSTLA